MHLNGLAGLFNSVSQQNGKCLQYSGPLMDEGAGGWAGEGRGKGGGGRLLPHHPHSQPIEGAGGDRYKAERSIMHHHHRHHLPRPRTRKTRWM